MQGSRRRGTRGEGGLESLLHYQPTHASVEDNMKEAVHMLDLLQPDQRKGFLRLFGQFVQQRHRPVVEWARLEQPPAASVVKMRDIPPCPKDQALRHELLDKMVILKLNGAYDEVLRVLLASLVKRPCGDVCHSWDTRGWC